MKNSRGKKQIHSCHTRNILSEQEGCAVMKGTVLQLNRPGIIWKQTQRWSCCFVSTSDLPVLLYSTFIHITPQMLLSFSLLSFSVSLFLTCCVHSSVDKASDLPADLLPPTNPSAICGAEDIPLPRARGCHYSCITAAMQSFKDKEPFFLLPSVHTLLRRKPSVFWVSLSVSPLR